MNESKQKEFVIRMGKRTKLYKGGLVKRKKMAIGGALSSTGAGATAGASVGSLIAPGIGSAIGGIAGGLTGFISGLFGGGGPQMPNITDPVTGQQITDANGRVVASQDQLNSFVQNLQGVNGVQNQQNVLGQLQAVASGQGPNPAIAQLNQATGTNVANQSALMAGQRGAGANVGLIAREAAQEGGALQQQAAGQAATLQAQQSLNALGQEGTIAGQQVAEEQGALTAANEAALNNQSQLLGAQTNFNSQITGATGNVNSTNASLTNAAIQPAVDLGKGALSGAGVANIASNTPVNVNGGTTENPGGATGGSSGLTLPSLGSSSGFAKGGRVMEGPHKSHVANYLTLHKGGKVKALVSPGEISLNPDQVRQVIREGKNPLEIGEKIPGKAEVKGDSTKNDTVPRNLDEGGIVIPRHITQMKDKKMAAEKAELFVHRHMAKRKAYR